METLSIGVGDRVITKADLARSEAVGTIVKELVELEQKYQQDRDLVFARMRDVQSTCNHYFATAGGVGPMCVICGGMKQVDG